MKPGKNDYKNFSRDDLAKVPRIDGIEILELAGEGGMSLVYKARQSQLDRIVAVKVLLHMAVTGEDGIRRFQKEAKLTSMLEHPNIVKTFSFGISRDGEAYLVMEYLEGLSLSDELEQHGRLKLQKFKDIFLPALSALAHAHNTGLIHRDIKPGNIMICRQENGVETVKLVDFGIAKVISDGKISSGKLTRTDVLIGTPAYMSPEQCQGKPLDGRSDLYSLSCIMYEALCGEPPFSAASPLEQMQKHCSELPPKVSDLVQRIDLGNQLAAAVLWGLEKDPFSRPQTAWEFAGKLSQVLDDMTLDRVPGLKISKQTGIKRNLVISVAALALVGLILLLFKPLQRTTSHELPSEKNASQVDPKVAAERQLLREKTRFENLLKSNSARDQTQSQIDETTEIGSKLYRDQMNVMKFKEAEKTCMNLIQYGRLKKLPDTQLMVWRKELGYNKQCQGDFSGAEKIFSEELSLLQKQDLGESSDACEYIAGMAQCNRLQGKYARAELLSKRLLAIQEKKLRPGHLNLLEAKRMCDSVSEPYVGPREEADKAKTRHLLAMCYIGQGKYAEAEPLLKISIAVLKKYLSVDDMTLAEILADLADCYVGQGKYAEAEPLLKSSSALWEKKNGPNDPMAAIAMADLANCLVGENKYAEAEPLFRRSLAAMEKGAHLERPEFLPATMERLALCYRRQGKISAAEQMSGRALEAREKTPLASHYDMTVPLYHLAKYSPARL